MRPPPDNPGAGIQHLFPDFFAEFHFWLCSVGKVHPWLPPLLNVFSNLALGFQFPALQTGIIKIDFGLFMQIY